VLAIGSAVRLDYSATARHRFRPKGRSLTTEQYVPFVQTTSRSTPAIPAAAVQHARRSGRASTRSFQRAGGYMGVSLRHPDRRRRPRRRAELKEHGKVTRGWLGVVVQEVDRGLAQSSGMKKPEGALISRIVPAGRPSRRVQDPATSFLSYNGPELPLRPACRRCRQQRSRRQRRNSGLMRDGKVDRHAGGSRHAGREPPNRRGEPAAPAAPHAGTLGVTVRALTPTSAGARRSCRRRWVAEFSEGAGRDAGLRKATIVLSLGGNEIGQPGSPLRGRGRSAGPRPRRCWCSAAAPPVFLALEIPPRLLHQP